MGSEWKQTTLGELGEFRNGANYNGKAYGDDLPVVTVKNLFRGRFATTDDLDAIRFDALPKHENYKLRKGDIIFARSSVKRSGAGQVAIANDLPADCIFSGFTIRFRPNQETKTDPLFLLYTLRSPAYREVFQRIATGTTVSNLSQSALGSVEIDIPPLPEQKAIAHILGTLDDKIELNRRMNATLEGMAQALFKSWFVDFDPVIDNALAAGNPIPDELAPRAEVRKKALANGTANREAAKPFPAAFQETESMGWIPEGWEVESIYKLISVIYGAPFKSSMFIPAGEGMPVIRIRDLKTGTPQNWTTEDHPKKKLIKTGDVVVGMDAEFRATIWPGENGYLNQRLFLARPKEGSVNNFFVQHSLAPQLEFEENTQVGTTVSHLGKKELDKFTALNPGKELLFEYSKATTPLLERLVSNHVALKTLTRLRDTLLPKLISGELRVSEAEQLTEEALT